jgi:hypothetical protein
MSLAPDLLADLVGAIVVVDLDGPWLGFGRLTRVTAAWIELSEADLHDLREGSSSRDVYALETQKHGVRVNRRRVVMPLAQIIAVSRLDEVTS